MESPFFVTVGIDTEAEMKQFSSGAGRAFPAVEGRA